MSDIKDWMPKKPEWNRRHVGNIHEYISEVKEYCDKIESLFKDAKVYYGQLYREGRPYDLGFVKTDSDTHEFLVIGRPIEKPKPKTDREPLEEENKRLRSALMNIVGVIDCVGAGCVEELAECDGLSDAWERAYKALRKDE